MRIWIVNQYAVSPRQAGPTRHYSFAREMILKGHEVTIIASSYDHVCRAEAHLHGHQWQKYEVVEGVPFLWLWTPSYQENDFWRVINMLTFAGWVWPVLSAQRLPPPDVVIGSVPTMFAALAASQLAGRFRIPFVLEVRDLWPQVLIDFLKLSPAHPTVRLLRMIEGYLYRCSARIITLLPGSVDYLAARSGRREKISWLPNGIDLTLVPAPTQPPGDGTFTVMFIGNHGLAYGLDVLLDAAVLLQREKPDFPVRFRLIGDGPEKKRLQARANREGIRTVCFEDPVPKRDVYPRLQQADAFLMMLKDAPVFRRGTSPNKVFDYLASVRPVIFCGEDTFDFMAKGKAGITVPPGDARALAQAVLALAETPAEILAEMGRSGRRYVEEHFSIDKLAVRLEEVLADAVTDFPANLPAGGARVANKPGQRD